MRAVADRMARATRRQVRYKSYPILCVLLLVLLSLRRRYTVLCVYSAPDSGRIII